MAQNQVEGLRLFLAEFEAVVNSGCEIICKPFFGGAAAYADNRIFMTRTKVGLALKLPESTRQRLLNEGATPLRYFPKGHIKKDYVLLPQHMLENKEAFSLLIGESMDFVLTFPHRG